MKSYFEKCRKCTERYPGCQDICPKGIAARKEYEEDKAKINEQKAEARLTQDYVRDRITQEKRWKR